VILYVPVSKSCIVLKTRISVSITENRHIYPSIADNKAIQ